ncbi:hypothetical protein [Hyalangium versicolor]|uniref:hypothetical protein n=1 Tax=Hyalangium versicolor TaxID=2861190 RepID=UPI001CCC07A3|nr:hypothetical protein [Hyalangium versicolor]
MKTFLPFLLLATAAVAETPPPPSSEVVALVWGGGKDEAAAQEWRRRWDEEQKSIKAPVSLGEGFPKIVSSASVPGMNPGFEIVLLGFCRKDESEPVRQFLKALYPFIYERPVKVETNACPTWADEGERTVEAPSVLKVRGATITVVVAPVKDSSSSSGPGQLVSVVARDGKSQLLGSYNADDSGSGFPGDACETSVEVRTADVVLERSCTHSVGAACNRYPGEKSRITVRWDGKALTATEKTLEKWSINMDKECAE